MVELDNFVGRARENLRGAASARRARAYSSWHRTQWLLNRRYARGRAAALLIPVASHATRWIGYGCAWWVRGRLLRAPDRAEPLLQTSERQLTDALERLQHAYFTYPWLAVRMFQGMAVIGKVCSLGARGLARVALVAGIGDPERNRCRLAMVPRDGYLAFMAAYTALAEAAGYYRAGDVHVAEALVNGRMCTSIPGRDPAPFTRLDPPRTPGDSLRDIDDQTFAARGSSVVKIIEVGAGGTRWLRPLLATIEWVRGSRRRWIVQLPGTDHLSLSSTSSPADPETNFREILGLESRQRQGIKRAVLMAMAAAGITDPAAIAQQRVMVIGHSQGAMIAMTMAHDPTLPFKVSAVVSAGGPIGLLQVDDNTRTVLALRHTQDCIPLFGGIAGEVDHRVVVMERSLSEPAEAPLYYAHAAGTYAETADMTGDYARHVPDSQVGRAWDDIMSFYPRRGEPSRVFVYELYQDVIKEDKDV